jgi:uncharacterized protein YlxP (DUF503 family)
MLIGLLVMEFTLHGNESLKGKRSVAQSIKHKLRGKFNLAVSEVEDHDSHTRLVLAAVSVGADYQHLQGRMTKALSMVEAATPEELTDSHMVIFNPSDP